jgi:membrane protein implicated in regulation of membrane protease activity
MTFLEWQNLIFLLPLGVAVIYVLLMSVGLSIGDHDVDVAHDVHLDAAHDVHLDAGHDVHAEAGHDAEHEAHAGHDGHAHHLSLLGSVLSLLGIGKVPISVILISFFSLWGGVGLALNGLFGADAIVKTLAFTALAAVGGTRLLAEGLGRLMPREESYHTPKEDLVGQVGEVLYEVTPSSGTVRLRDPTGNLLDLDCRSWNDERIPSGTRVDLVEYDPATDVFFVRASTHILGESS